MGIAPNGGAGFLVVEPYSVVRYGLLKIVPHRSSCRTLRCGAVRFVKQKTYRTVAKYEVLDFEYLRLTNGAVRCGFASGKITRCGAVKAARHRKKKTHREKP